MFCVHKTPPCLCFDTGSSFASHLQRGLGERPFSIVICRLRDSSRGYSRQPDENSVSFRQTHQRIQKRLRRYVPSILLLRGPQSNKRTDSVSMKIPLKHSSFSLDVSGIAGFFGGEESLAGMASVHLVRGRRWLGWYNSPGSLYVAKKYGTLARSRIWDGLFPGANVDPSSLLELDGKFGPRYIGVYSQTELDQTGHLAYLMAKYCDDLKPEDNSSPRPHANIPSNYFSAFDPFAIIPTIVSIATAVLCGLTRDWYSFAMIVLGIVCNGASCLVLGSGSLQVNYPIPSKHSPAGDGLLKSTISGQPLIILKGAENVVNCLVKGKYSLYYKSQDRYYDIGYSALALTIQFLAQLFLIPQGELFGQIMFLTSLGVSWVFNSYLASVDRDQLQMDMLLKILNRPKITKFYLPKWTAVVTFAAFSFKPGTAKGILDKLIPNNTPAWRGWKGRVVEAVATDADPKEVTPVEEPDNELDEEERRLLMDLLNQASIGKVLAMMQRSA
ncbi:hypothetical protein BDZ97DRAFT_1762594 [Flammula alnicola]|nr:hypothetical protein BDZ97DRAFT_1762594 [Flammula alnicola]